MREGRLVLAAAGGALLCALLSGCACGCPRPPGIPPIYPKSHLAFSAPSACCDVDPHGSPAGFVHSHLSPYAWQEYVLHDAKKEMLFPAALGVGALASRAFDTGLEDTLHNAFGGEQWIGDVGAESLVAASVAIGALHPREGRTVRDELWTQGEAFALTFGINEGLKYLVGRERPDLTDFLSFPSGHTSTAFCAATLIMRDAGPAVGVPAYGVAFLTGFSRVESGKHYVSDVLAGAALGTAVALAVDSLHFGNGTPGRGITGCAWEPEIGCGTDEEGRPAAWVSFKF